MVETENENLNVCCECGCKETQNTAYPFREFDNSWYCDDCFCDNIRECGECGELALIGEMSFNERREEYFCDDCFVNDDDDDKYEEVEIKFKIENSKTFKKNRFKNNCGYEIEAYYKNNCDLFDVEDLKSFDVQKQKGDGSLGHNGIEFNSNVFNGDLLNKNIDDFCGELKNRDYSVDKSCGLHIHIQINKRCEELKKIALFYKKFEEYFFKMVSPSRSNNRFCQKFSTEYPNLTDDRILSFKSNTEFKKALYQTKNYNRIKYATKDAFNSKRYSWLNLHSVFLRNTLELRLHNGTIEGEKIKNWFNINLTILEFLKGIKNPETINNLPKNKELFLSLFDKNIQQYIKSRWAKFE